MRALTYLSPGFPPGLFAAIVHAMGDAAGMEIDVQADATASGPAAGEGNPLAGDVDVAFMCSPPFLRLVEAEPDAVRLLGAAPLMHPGARPSSHSVLVCAGGIRASSLADLAGAVATYNDDESLSGRVALDLALRTAGTDATRFFGSLVRSGSHDASIDLLASGLADVAAIDAVVWRRVAGTARARDLRAISRLGPYPSQPIVVSTRIAETTRMAMREAVLAIAPTRVAEFGCAGFAPVDMRHYAQLRVALRSVGGPPAVRRMAG